MKEYSVKALFMQNLYAKPFCRVSEVNYAAEWVQNPDITELNTNPLH